MTRVLSGPLSAPKNLSRLCRHARALAPCLFGVPGGAVSRGRRGFNGYRRDHHRRLRHFHRGGSHGTPADKEPEPTEEQQHPEPHTLSFAHGRRDTLTGRPMGRGRVRPEAYPSLCVTTLIGRSGHTDNVVGGHRHALLALVCSAWSSGTMGVPWVKSTAAAWLR